jgi:L-threonylcarbamoyladenylate synthase
VLSNKGDLDEAAARLYAAMHELDSKKLELLLVEQLPNEGIGIAINDKLKRASIL